MTRKEALERQLADLTSRAEQTFVHAGATVLPRVIACAVEDSWVALCRDRDYERVDRLVAVVQFLIMREGRKFEADRAGWLKHQQDLAAA
jgi:hypothetical protein